MTKYLLIVDFQPGVDDSPMSDWEPAEIQAHLDYYEGLHTELVASGEMVSSTILAGPDVAKVVRSDGRGSPAVTEGPFPEFTEWVAGFQVVEVATEERALEIAARVSAVPGRGGVPLQQPIQVRQVVEGAPSDVEEMEAWLDTADGRG